MESAMANTSPQPQRIVRERERREITGVSTSTLVRTDAARRSTASGAHFTRNSRLALQRIAGVHRASNRRTRPDPGVMLAAARYDLLPFHQLPRYRHHSYGRPQARKQWQ